MGNDITAGQTFADGSTYPASTFNSAIADATIKAGFLAAKSPRSAVTLTDLTLISDAAGLALQSLPLSVLRSSFNASTSDATGVYTTGAVTSGTTSLVVASATGITAGMVVGGYGIPVGATVVSIAATTVTLSAAATQTLAAGSPVCFFPAVTTMNTPGISAGIVSQVAQTTASSAVSASNVKYAKAWVNFNGSTGAIRASYNVSSITKNNTGDYTISFLTAMSDSSYTIAGVSGSVGNSLFSIYPNTTPTTASFRISIVASDATARDASIICVQVFGN